MVAAIAAASCGPVRRGPLTIEIPTGWRVTRSTPTNVQMADGTAAGDDATTAGTAKAVFDLYLDSTHTVDSYRRLLDDGGARFTERRAQIGGTDAVVFSYAGAEFAGRQQAVLFGSYPGVLVVYRAAFPNDDAAYRRGLGAFERALESIRFVARPPSPAAA